MSRCFPYPPPGYALSSAGNEALIESIKFKDEKVKAKEHTKDKKREKKEKRKHKKDKKIQNLDSSDILHGCQIGGKLWTDSTVDVPYKGSKAESDQLERSSLTEEHAKPVCVRLPSCSSDSTENSNKRKRCPSPVAVSRGHGKIIRIRLSSKKQNQPDAPVVELSSKKQNQSDASVVELSSKKQNQSDASVVQPSSKKQKLSDASVVEQNHCSTSRRTHFPAQTDNDIVLTQRNEGSCSTSGPANNVGRCLVLKTGGERIRSASKIEISAPAFETIALPAADAGMKKMLKEIKIAPPAVETIALPLVDAGMKKMSKEGKLYKNLFENLVPPQLSFVDAGDEDWLFGSRSKVEQSEKRSVCRDDIMSCSNSSMLWPRAQFLPEVDIYALPFTVPF